MNIIGVETKIKKGVLLFLGFLTIFDTYTSYVGTVSILGDSNFSKGFSIIFALGISSMLISTVGVFEYGKYNGGFGKILILTWWIFFIYDIYTSWKGTLYLLYENSSNLTDEQFLILSTTTIFISTSSIVISNIVANR